MSRWADADDESESDDDDDSTAPCPYCSAEIHDDSERCPECGNYISNEDIPPSRKPWWILLGVAACLYAIYRWTFPR